MFSYFCVVNILTIITFKLPYSVTECTVRKEMHTSSSYEPEGATPSSQASHPTVFSILLSPPSFSHLFLLSPICVTVQSLYFVSGQWATQKEIKTTWGKKWPSCKWVVDIRSWTCQHFLLISPFISSFCIFLCLLLYSRLASYFPFILYLYSSLYKYVYI